MGRAAAGDTILVVDELPEVHLTISSGLGPSAPTHRHQQRFEARLQGLRGGRGRLRVQDAVLLRLAEILRDAVRLTDDVIRWRDEDWLVLVDFDGTKELVMTFCSTVGMTRSYY